MSQGDSHSSQVQGITYSILGWKLIRGLIEVAHPFCGDSDDLNTRFSVGRLGQP
jgi:hypothetical protein